MSLTTTHKLQRAGLLLIFCFLFNVKAFTQCTVAFNFTPTTNGSGQVFFLSSVTNTLGQPSYTWNFGAPGLAQHTGTAFASTNITYTASGFYVVSLTMTTGTCVATFSASVPIAVCSLSFSQTPTSPSLCVGTATPFFTGVCSPISYLWSSGRTLMVDTGLCAQVYTLTVFGASSPTCCASITGTVSIPTSTICLLNTSFTHSLNPNGGVQFNSTSQGTNSSSVYSWDFDDGTPVLSGTNFTNPYHTYTLNKTYFVRLWVNQPNIPGCVDSVMQTVAVNNYTPCTLNANYNKSVNNNTVTFVSTTTGTNTSSLYTWHFGDGSFPLSTSTPSTTHIYTTSGVFKTMLYVTNNFSLTGCGDSTALDSVMILGCQLASNFSTVQIGAQTIQFNSTSIFTTSSSTYFWTFGDGQTGSGSPAVHTYSTGGQYTVSLKVTNDTTCAHTNQAIIYIDTTGCTLSSAFLHTVGASGVVQYSAATTGSVYNYFWDFGDGTSSVMPNPTHSYVTGGNHYVTLIVSHKTKLHCRDSLTLAINITGIPCVANSGFSLSPTNTPKHWTATPLYPYNITSAVWSWGDGTTSSTLFTSHIYSASAVYSICLTVTVSCGATSSTCGNYNIFKSPSGGSDFYYVNVTAPPLKVAVIEEAISNIESTLFPNPTSGLLNIRLDQDNDAKFFLYDLSGRVLRSGNLINRELHQLDLSDLPAGVFFMELQSEGHKKVSRILISE